MSVFTREDLDEKNIFQLRTLARDLKVPSPTTCNKSALIDKIIERSSGDAAPGVPRPKGRPSRLVRAPAGNAAAPAARDRGDQAGRPEDRRRDRPAPQGRYRTAPTRGDEDVSRDAVPDDMCEEREGILDVHPDGYGFIRVKNCEHSANDVYVSTLKIRKSGLRRGDYINGIVKISPDGKPAALLTINTVNGIPADRMGPRKNFDDLIPIYPDDRIKLENFRSRTDFAIRCIDLIAPIGKGQRAMIVSPPKAGKTTLLKKIANSISENYPDIVLMVLLIDERPEEVTDMQRSIKGEVVYSTFDEMPEHHTKAAELLLARAKRLVEMDKDVVILMDSLTRLARAYNLTIPPTGRTLSGGIDPGALHSPKRFFGSARNIENGGSLTIVATALIDTGSRMDDVIYEEFKGTGNMEIHLDRKLSEKRIFPAIDLNRSSTRREDLLLSRDELEGIWSIRKVLSGGDSESATENLLQMLVKTKDNNEFINQLRLQLKIMDKEGYTLRNGLK